MKILVTWLGARDLEAMRVPDPKAPGPVASALDALTFDRVLLIADWGDEANRNYVDWLSERQPTPIKLYEVERGDPTDFSRIHSIVDQALKGLFKDLGEAPDLTFHLSAGTSQMATIWSVLANTRYPAELIQSSKEAGVQTVTFPFELSAELLPKLLEPSDARLSRLSAGLAEAGDEEIQFRSPAMARLMKKTDKAAQRSAPVLIEGEPGTEKESLARAIHNAGPRRDQPFIAVNCGAIPDEDLPRYLFGDDQYDEPGAFGEAIGGTLYLEEVEELPHDLQARIEHRLEMLDTSARVIAASRGNLMDKVTTGEFREGLFFALAVFVLKLPPLRERTGDLGPMVERLLAKINEQSVSEPGFAPKSLSPAAKNFLMQQSWPGNVRELQNTLRRAVVLSDAQEISEADMWDALLPVAGRGNADSTILGRQMEDGIDLQEIMAEVARHYIMRAIEQSEGNKSVAAKLVQLPSYQTLTNWMKKYGVT